MATEPNPSPPKAVPGAVTVKDALHAPVIYFDGAPNFGCNNGIVNVTLAVAPRQRQWKHRHRHRLRCLSPL
jgi:hypothetical protein